MELRRTKERSMQRRKFTSISKKLEREKGFEPSTSTLARLHSTAELLPLEIQSCLLFSAPHPSMADHHDPLTIKEFHSNQTALLSQLIFLKQKR